MYRVHLTLFKSRDIFGLRRILGFAKLSRGFVRRWSRLLAPDRLRELLRSLSLRWGIISRLASSIVRVALCAVLVAMLLGAVMLSSPGAFGRDSVVDVYLAEGLSAGQMGEVLEDAGLVWSSSVFAGVARLRGVDRSLQPGHYRFSTHSGLIEILRSLSKGDYVRVKVTIPEGSTIADIGRILARSGVVSEEQFVSYALGSGAEFADVLGFDPPFGSLEGFLYPDTYLLLESYSIHDIAELMVRRFSEVTTPLLQNLPFGLDRLSVITLASIVEKEAAIDSDRPVIASVLLNRLRTGMPLQSCATVIYALPERKSVLSQSDLRVESPYNTYLHSGLPPGPIASPGLKSLQAVLSPQETDYLFFVADGKGGHIFTRAYSEHLKAIQALAVSASTTSASTASASPATSPVASASTAAAPTVTGSASTASTASASAVSAPPVPASASAEGSGAVMR